VLIRLRIWWAGVRDNLWFPAALLTGLAGLPSRSPRCYEPAGPGIMIRSTRSRSRQRRRRRLRGYTQELGGRRLAGRCADRRIVRVWSKDVSPATNSFDGRCGRRPALKPQAKPPEVDIKRSPVQVGTGSPDQILELLPAKHPTGLCGEHTEQAKLGRSKSYVLAANGRVLGLPMYDEMPNRD
jgi:hypothetical protein